MAEQYRQNIQAILRNSDLSTITTKRIRRELEAQTGTSLDYIKKEVNSLIEEIFIAFQQQDVAPPTLQRPSAPSLPPQQFSSQSSSSQPSSSQTSERVVKQRAPTNTKKAMTTRKDTTKKKQDKKPIDWPLYKVHPPLSNIIDTDLCSRPQTVKKMWEYIKKHDLQSQADKRVINCDEKLKLLCDNLEQVSAFTINKYTQKCFEKIPTDEQPKYKKILHDREELQSSV